MRTLTVIDGFKEVISFIRDGSSTLTREECLEFLEKRLQLLEDRKEKEAERKANGEKTLTPTQRENETIKVDIVEFFESNPEAKQCKELVKIIPSLSDASTQKVSALCNALVKKGKLVKTTDSKKVTTFALAV